MVVVWAGGGAYGCLRPRRQTGARSDWSLTVIQQRCPLPQSPTTSEAHLVALSSNTPRQHTTPLRCTARQPGTLVRRAMLLLRSPTAGLHQLTPDHNHHSHHPHYHHQQQWITHTISTTTTPRRCCRPPARLVAAAAAKKQKPKRRTRKGGKQPVSQRIAFEGVWCVDNQQQRTRIRMRCSSCSALGRPSDVLLRSLPALVSHTHPPTQMARGSVMKGTMARTRMRGGAMWTHKVVLTWCWCHRQLCPRRRRL